ncbi:hypothetical protein [Streptomyces sedi]|uniref:Uncharacterized protein n=1 Tax=Streptomyces sedi TaxID=555059 RepID=A0A5C4V9S9_9ACTN|nr:hypothetical protein [Streptomyces sedi]TNM32256.1 hypothetical protein FH715_07645 [Streptomyces sedi]
MIGLLSDLHTRIPDRWLLRRLLPAALFVMLAFVGGGQLGHGDAGDVGLARERLTETLRPAGDRTADGLASLLLLAAVAVAASFAVPVAADAVGALASGAWPWWLMPLGRRLIARRVDRWAPPGELGRESVRARAAGTARDAYGAACEALVWSGALVLLGAWWWPAAPAGVLLWAASWLSLRRAVDALCRTTDAVVRLERSPEPGGG